MGPVRIRHNSHDFGWQSSHSVDLVGGKPKWLPLKFGSHDVVRTSPIRGCGVVLNSTRRTRFTEEGHPRNDFGRS